MADARGDPFPLERTHHQVVRDPIYAAVVIVERFIDRIINSFEDAEAGGLGRQGLRLFDPRFGSCASVSFEHEELEFEGHFGRELLCVTGSKDMRRIADQLGERIWKVGVDERVAVEPAGAAHGARFADKRITLCAQLAVGADRVVALVTALRIQAVYAEERKTWIRRIHGSALRGAWTFRAFPHSINRRERCGKELPA